jgi:hypothetical protein
MNIRRPLYGAYFCLILTLAGTGPVSAAPEAAPDKAAGPSALRLVPFPKEIHLDPGRFDLQGPLVLEVLPERAATLGALVGDEFQRAGYPRPKVATVQGADHALRLSRTPGTAVAAMALRGQSTPEDYTLRIAPAAVVATAPGPAGLLYAAQTLCQLIRANRRQDSIPCLTVRDWPSLRWRGFEDDLTRGPSSRWETLRFEAGQAAALKMNLMSYYMEYQFAFRKHPEIGPPDGSLQPDELRRLVQYARGLSVEVLGNQQSFGHFARILEHPQFAAMRETSGVLSPVREETYKLLDDLYSEVCPLVPFPFFNVCCDETYGLGTGPSRELAERIGEGGVYAMHLRRIHDLLKDKYGKRMMMWGDIILRHPDHLREIPKDTVLLTWGYGARESFADQILPFTRSGYEFFVCPGVSNWSRILPDFGVATVNIRNFVRDGARHGALGMLNTEWEDDGESHTALKWHGYAWGAECAWNASATTPDDFNRRIGAVLFGERDDHFGRAIARLTQADSLLGRGGALNRRFWENDFVPRRPPAAVEGPARRLLELVRPAIDDLQQCRRQATLNGDLLDCFLFGARRVELIAQRRLDGLEACRLYDQAARWAAPKGLPLLAQVEAIVDRNRQAHAALGRQFAELWLKQSKPYGLDWTTKRYESLLAWYDALAARLAAARRGAERLHQPLPGPDDVGLAMEGEGMRRTRPQRVVATPLEPEAAWEEPDASHRLGLVVAAGAVVRAELPIEVDLDLKAELATRPVRAFCTLAGGPACEVLAQLGPSPVAGKSRLVAVLPGPIAKQGRAAVRVYLGLPRPPHPLPGAVSTHPAHDGMQWIENDKVRLLLGPEGAHVYRWEVKALADRNVTMPGEKGWAGFADLGGSDRKLTYRLTCTAAGPALVRYVATTSSGQTKTVSLFGGAAWIEVALSEPAEYYWDFDNPKNFAADGPSPGQYLFSTGATGAVGRTTDGVAAQVRCQGASWAVKWNPARLALGLVTPDAPATLKIAPGGGAGGVGIEGSSPTAHFVTYAGLLQSEPRLVMERLRQTLAFRDPPAVTVHGVQER